MPSKSRRPPAGDMLAAAKTPEPKGGSEPASGDQSTLGNAFLQQSMAPSKDATVASTLLGDDGDDVGRGGGTGRLDTAVEIQGRLNKLRNPQELMKVAAIQISKNAEFAPAGKALGKAGDSLGLGIRKLPAAARAIDAMEDLDRRKQQAEKLLKTVEVIEHLSDNRKLDRFLSDPEDWDAASEWATDTASLFGELSMFVPDGIPFVSDMLKGYLSAPKHYVDAFLSIFAAYEKRFEQKGADSMDGGAQFTGYGRWRGTLSRYFGNSASPDMRDFMRLHDDELYRAPSAAAGGRAIRVLLTITLQDEVGDEAQGEETTGDDLARRDILYALIREIDAALPALSRQ